MSLFQQPAALPLLMTPAVRQWQCRRRGACCKSHHVPLEDGEQERIANALRRAGDPRADFMVRPLPEVDGKGHLPMTAARACVFLSDDNHCQLRRFGTPPVYPTACQRFPYLGIATDDRVVFGLTLQCPTALELFAEEARFEPTHEPAGARLPAEPWVVSGADERACIGVNGETLSDGALWSTYWSWLDRFRSRPETDPIARLTRFAMDVTGEREPSRPMLPSQHWQSPLLASSIPRQLERLTGAHPGNLEFLWIDLPREDKGPLPTPNTDADGLLLRYLLHRWLVPTHFLARVDLGFHLTTLFAMACRWRIELMRGHPPIVAARHLDTMFVHIANAAELLGTEESYPHWLPLCALANAVTV